MRQAVSVRLKGIPLADGKGLALATNPLLAHDLVGAWLESLGRTGAIRLESVEGGGNNLAYRVDVAGEVLFLKLYRDRERAVREFAILELLAAHGLNQVARPVALHTQEPWALHQFVAARKPGPEDLPRGLQESRTFLQQLRGLPTAGVPVARDAFTGYADHLEHVRCRIQSLGAAELEPEWEQLCRLPVPRAPASSDFWVSPSDFGFHNALVREDGSFCFVDFEYAGLDESCKVVCDFFCQPQLPAPLESLPTFLQLLSFQAHRRMNWMWRVTTLKWACIIRKRPQPQARLEWLRQRREDLLSMLEAGGAWALGKSKKSWPK